MNPSDVRVVFMGSPAFAVPSLRALASAGYNLAGVVTQPDRPAGRGGKLKMPEVKEAALQLGLPVFQPPTLKADDARALLRAYDADLFVVAAYGKILARSVLAMPRRGCVNVHASLLPRWRGASPINAAILAGDPETGVSIMEVAPEMDAGPVIARRAEPIRPGDTTGTLEPRLATLGADLLVETLPGWYDGLTPAVPQDESLVTTCKLISKDDGLLSSRMTATEAERAVRAYNSWPGAFVLYRGERLAIWRARVAPLEGSLATGSLIVAGKLPAIAFRDGLLMLDEVQRPGSPRRSGQEFLNGERGAPAPEVVLRD